MIDPDPDNAFEPLDPDRLTWAVLLARWTEFARGAAALPDDDSDAGLVRQSVADIITLQAVWFALRDLGTLPADQRGIGLDRAGVLIARHRDAIRQRFDQTPLPSGLIELIRDTESIYRLARGRDL